LNKTEWLQLKETATFSSDVPDEHQIWSGWNSRLV